MNEASAYERIAEGNHLLQGFARVQKCFIAVTVIDNLAVILNHLPVFTVLALVKQVVFACHHGHVVQQVI